MIDMNKKAAAPTVEQMTAAVEKEIADKFAQIKACQSTIELERMEIKGYRDRISELKRCLPRKARAPKAKAE